MKAKKNPDVVTITERLHEQKVKLEIDLMKFGQITDDSLYLRLENKDFLKERGYRYFISLAAHISEAAIELLFLHSDEGPMSYFHAHTQWRAAQLDSSCQQLCLLLEEHGYRAFLVMGLGKGYRTGIPQVFSHIAGAMLSGMGVIGDSGMIITPEFGPRVRLATILTDCPLPIGEICLPDNLCNHCGLCKAHCPSKAVLGEQFDPLNPTRDMTNKLACEAYRQSRLETVNTRFCNLCMAACPVAKRL